jgi:hypothetical protein
MKNAVRWVENCPPYVIQFCASLRLTMYGLSLICRCGRDVARGSLDSPIVGHWNRMERTLRRPTVSRSLLWKKSKSGLWRLICRTLARRMWRVAPKSASPSLAMVDPSFCACRRKSRAFSSIVSAVLVAVHLYCPFLVFLHQPFS